MIYEVIEKFHSQPVSLRETGIQQVSEKVIETVWRGTLNFQSIYIPEPVERGIREWLNILPPLIRQDLLQTTVKGILRSASRVTPYNSSTIPILISSLAEILYSPNMNTVEVWTDLHWHQDARMKFLHLLHSIMSGVRKLVFSCYRTPIFQFQELHFSEKFLLMNIFNKFPQLRVLILPFIADDEILAKLGGGVCPLLETLDIEGSWAVSNQGLSALAGQHGGMVIGRAGWKPTHFAQCTEGQKLLGNILQGSPVTVSQLSSIMAQHQSSQGMLKSLKHINIKGTSTDSKGLECLVQNFRCLLQLEAEEQIWQNFLVQSECRECYPENLPLQNINMKKNTFTLLPYIFRLFPGLEKLSFTNYTRSETFLDGTDNMALLPQFKSLRELNLCDVDMNDVLPRLQGSVGLNLQVFRYSSTLKTLDVGELSGFCPNLTLLSISNSVVRFEVPKKVGTVFPRLSSLYLQDVTFRRDEQCCWKQLLYSTRLEHISLYNIRLTDGDIHDLVRRDCLQNLKDISIAASFTVLLSEASIYRLLNSCKRLEKIGGVCSWSMENLVDTLHIIKSKYNFKIKMGDVD